MADPLRPTLLTRLRAGLGGEQDARVLEALRQAGMAAYQELNLADQTRDRLVAEGATAWTAAPGAGSQLLAAWAAVALQRLGETILDTTYAANPRTVGYVYPVTFRQAWRWLSGVEDWLMQAGRARGHSDYDISAELVLPARLPVGPVARDCPAEHRDAMLMAMAVLREDAEAALHRLERQPSAAAERAVARLRQMAGQATASADYITALQVAHDDTRLHGMIDNRVRVALNLWFHIGQLAAMPTLLASYQVPSAVRLLTAGRPVIPSPRPPASPPPSIPARGREQRYEPADDSAERPASSARPAGSSTGRTSPPLLTGAEVAGERHFEGRGNALLGLDLPESPHTAVITHQGTGSFIVWSATESGRDIALVVNQIGAHRGEHALNLVEVPSALKVSAAGTWRIVVRPIEATPEWTGNAYGEGPAVLRVPAALTSGLTTARFSHEGVGFCSVIAYAEYAESLVIEAGSYVGDLLLPEDTFALGIDADGPWTLREL